MRNTMSAINNNYISGEIEVLVAERKIGIKKEPHYETLI